MVPTRNQIVSNDGLIREVVKDITDNFTWSKLPILADALEDVGYANQEVLDALRGWEYSKNTGTCLLLLSEIWFVDHPESQAAYAPIMDITEEVLF